ncbi:MAG: c-type cytochrome, partial [Sandaracinaceae bacterium]|nr:c-type cytochrome [Sandaracinaceae bacterium]
GCRGYTSSEPPVVVFRGMHEMPRYDAQEKSDYFEDKRTMRPEVGGTVAREMEVDGRIRDGLEADGSYVSVIPNEVIERKGGMARLLSRGRERYNIYCAPCHSERGDGNGMVSERAKEIGVNFQAANLLEPVYQHMPDGRLYLTIANGVRTMPSYRAQIPVDDRWAIVAYVRALQLSQGRAVEAIADADGDQIPAGADGCTEQPEDRDGFQDGDGCPELDNDADGIADAADLCPLSPGKAEAQGCAGLVQEKDGRLELAKAIAFVFGSDVLQAGSHAVLDEIRALLVARPSLRLAIKVDLEERGDPGMRRWLAERRLAVLRRWLIEKGIAPDRIERAPSMSLQVSGKGEGVEFQILEGPGGA